MSQRLSPLVLDRQQIYICLALIIEHHVALSSSLAKQILTPLRCVLKRVASVHTFMEKVSVYLLNDSDISGRRLCANSHPDKKRKGNVRLKEGPAPTSKYAIITTDSYKHSLLNCLSWTIEDSPNRWCHIGLSS